MVKLHVCHVLSWSRENSSQEAARGTFFLFFWQSSSRQRAQRFKIKVSRQSVAEWKMRLGEKVSKAAEQQTNEVQGQKLFINSQAMFSKFNPR